MSGSGFLGRRVVAAAASRGYKVIGLASFDPAAAALGGLGASVVRTDLDDAAGTRAAFAAASADALLNLATLRFGHAGTIVDDDAVRPTARPATGQKCIGCRATKITEVRRLERSASDRRSGW